MSDEWWRQEIILWRMNDEGGRSYYEWQNGRWMMNDERSYYEGWEMMKTEDHIMNDEWGRQKIYVNDECRRLKDHNMNDEWQKQKIILWMMKAED